MVYDLTKTERNEVKLFFNMGGEGAERHGSVCNFWRNMEHGGSGKMKQFGRQQHMETSAFMADAKRIVDYLGGNGMETPPLRSPQDFKAFCRVYGVLAMDNYDVEAPSTFGLKIISESYSYYLRCHPDTGLFYMYCYDNRWLLPELAGKHKIPDVCYSTLPSTGDLILIKKGEEGYYPVDYSTDNLDINRRIANDKNMGLGVTRAQEEACLVGSMAGWTVPGAKPWKYDRDGNLRPAPPKKDAPER
jgi:hypothetical protein